MKYFLYDSYAGHWATPVHPGNPQSACWTRNIKSAKDFGSREAAEEFARTKRGYENMRIFEINNSHSVRPDQNDDGENIPIQRPPGRRRRGPRFRQRRGILRTINNPNALNPIDQKVFDNIVENHGPSQQRVPTPPVTARILRNTIVISPIERAPAPPQTVTPPEPANVNNVIPECQQTLRLNRAGITRPYRPGDMTEYGWYDAETEEEIAEWLANHPYETRDHAIVAIFNGM